MSAILKDWPELRSLIRDAMENSSDLRARSITRKIGFSAPQATRFIEELRGEGLVQQAYYLPQLGLDPFDDESLVIIPGYKIWEFAQFLSQWLSRNKTEPEFASVCNPTLTSMNQNELRYRAAQRILARWPERFEISDASAGKVLTARATKRNLFDLFSKEMPTDLGWSYDSFKRLAGAGKTDVAKYFDCLSIRWLIPDN